MRWMLLALSLGLVGCSWDLFHSTEWETYCDQNPSAQACDQADSGTDTGSETDSAAKGSVTKDATSE